MKECTASTVEQLSEILEAFSADCLFRGQVTHFEKNGCPSVATSFDRKGCVPSKMLKWSRYANSTLSTFIGPCMEKLEFTQALLQHYGWRSFFVDCSERPAVAAWFASHAYSEKSKIELSEDCEEEPVMLVKRMAKYEFAEGTGHLYVFSKAAVGKLIGAVDLASLDLEDSRPRTSAQAAWLIGPIRESEVPIEGFLAHITAPRAILRDYAAQQGLRTTHDLFPPVTSDPILRTLLSLPWKLIAHPENTPDDIQFFERALDLPEYDNSFAKIASKGVAFFRGARVADRDSIDGVKNGGIVKKVPEIALFGSADEAPLQFPEVNELLSSHGAVAFEIDDIIMPPVMKGNMLYQKGIVAVRHEPDLVELGELMVEHPGLELTRAGMVRGWFYRIGGDGPSQTV